MKVWTDKQGNELTAKEFMQRWKEGILKVTPLQTSKINLLGYAFVFAGIGFGLLVSIWARQYWLFLILVGSAIISSTQALAAYQKYLAFKEIERRFEENESESKNIQST